MKTMVHRLCNCGAGGLIFDEYTAVSTRIVESLNTASLRLTGSCMFITDSCIGWCSRNSKAPMDLNIPWSSRVEIEMYLQPVDQIWKHGSKPRIQNWRIINQYLADFLALLLINDEIIRPSSERQASLRFLWLTSLASAYHDKGRYAISYRDINIDSPSGFVVTSAVYLWGKLRVATLGLAVHLHVYMWFNTQLTKIELVTAAFLFQKKVKKIALKVMCALSGENSGNRQVRLVVKYVKAWHSDRHVMFFEVPCHLFPTGYVFGTEVAGLDN